MKKVVVITGASRGLGLSLTRQFLERGDVVIGISRTTRWWPKVKKNLGKDFPLYKADLTEEAAVSSLLKRIIKKYRRIDILVNNAGIGGRLERVEDTTAARFRSMLEANLTASFFTCKHVIKHMRRRKQGLILNIASMAGKRAVPRLAAYSASKFGMVALSQALAKENVDRGVKCLTICPGGMNTSMRGALFGREDQERQQTTDFVASVIMDVVQNKVRVPSGGDIVIRYGKITAINEAPGA